MYTNKQRKPQQSRVLKPSSRQTVKQCSYAIQCQWEKSSDDETALKWSKLRSGIQWYYADGYYWYNVIKEEDIPEDLVECYKKYKGSDNKKDYYQWIELSSFTMNDLPGFGMELELKPRSGSYYATKKGVEEKEIKAIEIFSLVDNKVKVTFDTLTGYNKSSSNKLTIELIFDASKIPLNSDLEALGDTLVYEIRKMQFAQFNENFNERFSDKIEMIDTSQTGFMFPENMNVSLNIHITIAMNLDNLGFLMQTNDEKFNKIQSILGLSNYSKNQILFEDDSGRFFSDDETILTDGNYAEAKDTNDTYIFNHTTFHKATDSTFSFIRIFQKLFDYSDTFYKESSNDPKQAMNIMNRTSMVKMFSMLKKSEQYDILWWMYSLINEKKTWKLTFDSKITFEDLYNTLCKKYLGENITDPTYNVNEKEKIGISHLGDKIEKDLAGNDSPILEFRVGGGNVTLDTLPKYLGDLRRILAGLYSVSK